MTAPMHAHEVKGKGRYYAPCGDTCPLQGAPEPGLISVTNAQDVVAKPALVPAAVKVTAETAWTYLPHMVRLSRQPEAGRPADGGKPCEKRSPVSTRCGNCRFCLNMAIKREHKNQWEAKADFGSLVHTHAYAHVVGQPIQHDPDVAPFIGQYLQWLTAWQVDITRHVEAAETTVFDHRHGYAGTGDVWVSLPLNPRTGGYTGPGGKRHLWLVDLKTSLTKPATAVYADQVLQLAGLRYAPRALLADDTEISVPKFAGAALLNLRAGEHALIPLPADRAAHKAFLSAAALQRFFHESVDTKAWAPLDAPPATEPTTTQRKAS